jgi:hypothetical protein
LLPVAGRISVLGMHFEGTGVLGRMTMNSPDNLPAPTTADLTDAGGRATSGRPT